MNNPKYKSSGFALPMTIAILLVIMILLPALIMWTQQDTKMSVKEQKVTAAYNLATAAVDRGMWKLKSSTTTWAVAAAGIVMAGYNFDSTYTDVPGGNYRIKFSSGPGNYQVTIWGEGRDFANKETRSIKEIVQNQTIYSAIMAAGNITWAKGLGVYWGPIMSQGNLQLMDDYVAALYFPLKYAKGAVIGTATYPRDTNGLAPPNTDNVEWWSEYAGVPPVPVLDFATLRASAAITGTLNVYGCKNSAPVGAWDLRAACASGGNHNLHFGDSWNHPLSARYFPNTDYVWYWDGDVTLSGAWCGNSPCNQSAGIRGTVIVRGNLTIDTPGEYNYVGRVPPGAWQQETKLTQNTNDTNASGEYPADIGFHNSAATFRFGTDTWCQPNGGGCGWRTTVGIKGFTYIGGNLIINQFLDFNGAVWVNGSVSASGGTNTSFCGVFYDDTLQVPTLNVILLRLSYKEVTPSTAVWP